MRAGLLRHNVTIKRQDTTNRDASGEASGWVQYVALNASIEPLQGRELVAANAAYGLVTHRVRTRYYPGITSAMRVYYGTRFFNIVAPLNTDERNRELVLMCVEGAGDA